MARIKTAQGDITKEQYIAFLVDLGVSRDKAKFLAAMEYAEIAGDVVEVRMDGTERVRKSPVLAESE